MALSPVFILINSSFLGNVSGIYGGHDLLQCISKRNVSGQDFDTTVGRPDDAFVFTNLQKILVIQKTPEESCSIAVIIHDKYRIILLQS